MIMTRMKEGVMNIRKIALTVFSIAIALSLIAASVLPASGFQRYQKGETASFNQGRPASASPTASLQASCDCRADDSRIKAKSPGLSKPLEVRLNKSGGEKSVCGGRCTSFPAETGRPAGLGAWRTVSVQV
jgi:hypothetical protein